MTVNRETAWLSLKDTLLHIIWAEDSWINYTIQGLDDPNRPFNYSRYQIWDSITDYNSKVISKVDEYLYNALWFRLDCFSFLVPLFLIK
jgi:hypothetical protein